MTNLLTRIKNAIVALRPDKTEAELATDYEIHPKSLLYRLCDWIGKKTGTIILTPHITAVGNCAEDVYFGLLKARREGKKLVILWPYELPRRLKFRLTNVEVVNVESEYRAIPHDSFLNIVGRVLITAYFAFFRTLSLVRRLLFGVHLNNVYRIPIIGESTLWHPVGVSAFSWNVVDQYDWPKQLETQLKVFLGETKQLLATRQRRLMGLPEEAWFVCLHVRQSGFRDSEFYKEKDSYDERNANIFNYLCAIEEITSRGGWVVRMGDASMTKLPAMERVIDYPFTDSKSALMDVYLISQCSLYIGMTSGIYDVAQLFQRPIIMTNMYNWLFGLPLKKGDMGIMKHIFSKKMGRFITIREWLAEPWDADSFLGKDNRYIYYENTSEELKTIVKEFFVRGDNWVPTPLQGQFNELRIARGKEVISNQLFFADHVQLYYRKNVVDHDIVERYRLASRLESAVGMLGADFLQKNWECDVLNKQEMKSPCSAQ